MKPQTVRKRSSDQTEFKGPVNAIGYIDKSFNSVYIQVPTICLCPNTPSI
jgi:hypothetical protein